MKSNLMVNNARMKGELSQLEDTILQMLSASQGNILDDEHLIDTLAVSKVCILQHLCSACRRSVEADQTRMCIIQASMCGCDLLQRTLWRCC